MSNPCIIVNSFNDIQELRNEISCNIVETGKLIREFSTSYNTIFLLRHLKFDKMVQDALFDYDTNFIEYLNQTFTYLVAIIATEKLMKIYPHQTFELNFGTRSGYDIISSDKSIICECFAATSPKSNMKLKKDVERVNRDTIAQEKYIAFYCENNDEEYISSYKEKYSGISFLIITVDELIC